jgi:predicted porin
VELANWFLRHDRLGEIRVGRINSASSGTTTVDLGGAGVIANANALLWMGGMFVTNGADATITSAKWGALMGGNTVGIAALSRQNAVSYTSPTLHGFSVQAAFGEQDAINNGMWDVALRYAGEFSGFRVAAAVSYGENAGNTSDFQDSAPLGGESEKWQGSASILHVATGLFLTGAFVEQEYGGAMAGVPETTYWYMQGGITRNWTGLGNTVLYGEYGRFEDGGVGFNLDSVTPDVITGSEVSFFGLGVVQHIDAAAMEVYLSYRRYEASVTTDTGDFGPVPVGSLDDLSIVAAGARIRF